MTINENNFSLIVGATNQLTVTRTPVDADDQTLKFVSVTPGIATVSETGLVTAVAAGTATIVASNEAPDETAIGDSITVTVTTE